MLFMRVTGPHGSVELAHSELFFSCQTQFLPLFCTASDHGVSATNGCFDNVPQIKQLGRPSKNEEREVIHSATPAVSKKTFKVRTPLP